MKKIRLKEDVKVLCVTARSFPHGIIAAFKKLESLHPTICERPFYGISFFDQKGNIVYKAAVAEDYEGEGKTYGCETFVINKGEYLSETIVDFMKTLDIIPKAFGKLTADPRMDRDFPCVEWYKSSREVICLVKLKLNIRKKSIAPRYKTGKTEQDSEQ